MPCTPKHTIWDIDAITETLSIPLRPAASPVEPVTLTVNAFIKGISAFRTIDFIHIRIIFFRELLNH